MSAELPSTPSRAPQWVSQLMGGAFAGAALCLIELALVMVLCSGRFAGLWELQWGTAWFLPGAISVSAILGAAGALLTLALRSARPSDRLIGAVVVGILCATFLFGVTHGRHFEPWWRRAGVIALGAFVGFAAANWVGPRLSAVTNRFSGTAAAAIAACIVLLELGNRFLLVRLYPGFHFGLAVACLLLAGAASSLLLSPRPSRRAQWVGLATTAVAIALSALTLPAFAARLAAFDNYRFVLAEQAPLGRELLRVPSWLAKPEPIRSDEALPADEPQASGISFAGKDVLLVTIDALRADHVGAYGYGRNTTPHIDALAASGVRFEFAYCATPHTSYSVTSLMTGKYIRPLLLQGAGADSETFADHLRRYGYRTAAFFPPALFFIDQARFSHFDESNLGFEYVKREFLEGPARVEQVREYLAGQDAEHPVFVWVHLFGPHEPYEQHRGFEFGDRDIDRYDSEVARADETVGALVAAFTEKRENPLVIVSADHGEEFGEHGGRYHGSSVYEEQVRVPLVLWAPSSLPKGKVVEGPVQTIDLLPTVLRGLDIPTRPRIRGRDLLPLVKGSPDPTRVAYAETDRHSMFAKGSLRLICERQIGACQLFDLAKDPRQQRDVSAANPDKFQSLRDEMRKLNASHGRYEQAGLREEGKGWPPALLRAMAGDGDAALDVAELLDDADVAIRRKAAEVLFRAHHPDTAAALRLSVQRDEDPTVRNYAALALTRLGQGASVTGELLDSDELLWRRLAALALAEQGDKRGEEVLIAWWQDTESRDYETSLDILAALGKLRAEAATPALVRSLPDVRLRPMIAETLATIGEQDARGPLARAFRAEPYQSTRTVLADALLALGADNELVIPLRRWMGVPDPLASGLRVATEAGILEHVGGPSEGDLQRLRENANLGELVTLIVPKSGNGNGVRILVEAENTGKVPHRVLVGRPLGVFSFNSKGERIKSRKVPEIHNLDRIELRFEPGQGRVVRWADASPGMALAAGRSSHLVVYAEPGMVFHSIAAVPHQDEVSAQAEDDEAEDGDRGGRSPDENP